MRNALWHRRCSIGLHERMTQGCLAALWTLSAGGRTEPAPASCGDRQGRSRAPALRIILGEYRPPMRIDDTAQDLVHREIRILQAFIREEERHRRRLVREISAVHLWQNGQGHSALAQWISRMTVQRRESELQEVSRNLERLRKRLQRLSAKVGESLNRVVDPEGDDPIENPVADILARIPACRAIGGWDA